MTGTSVDRRGHWDRVYATRPADAVSWYRPHLDVSLELLELGGLATSSRVIDVGGGASTLVDDLLDRGVRDITVLDVADAALAAARGRLGSRGAGVKWLAVDVLEAALPEGGFDFWHDRAVVHFLTDPSDAARYADQARHAVCHGGHAVISGFAPSGPEKCSGLPVARRSSLDFAHLLGRGWTLLADRNEQHRTPAGIEQAFAYALLRRD